MSDDPRCVAHSMRDDPGATDLAEAPYREATAAAVRGMLDTLEGAWATPASDAGAEGLVGADDAHDRVGGGGLRGGSMYVGSCGAGMLLYKLAMVQRSIQGGGDGGEPPLFGRSTELLLRAALGHCKSARAAMTTGSGRRHERRVTFLEGEAGCHALSAAILTAMGKTDAAAASVERLVAMKPDVEAMPLSECEVLYGRCGYLHALLFARKHVGGPVAKALLPPEVFQGIIAQVVAEGARGADAAMEEAKATAAAAMSKQSEETAAAAAAGAAVGKQSETTSARTWGLLYEWHGKRYLGCCHGVAGIALTLLQCEAELGWEDGQCWRLPRALDGSNEGGVVPASRVRDATAALTSRLFEDGNLPSSTTSSSGNRLVQWCHGAPGLLPLLAAAVGHSGPSTAPAR